jgi:hypothetical protein
MYSIWCRGVLLGRTDLAMQSPGPNARAGTLDTSAEFDRVWPEIAPVVDEFVAAGMAMGSLIEAMPPLPEGLDPLERGRRIYEHLSGHPGAVRVREASAALASLGLALHDDADNRVATAFIMVQEVKLPAGIPPEAVAHDMAEARRQGLDLHIPFYIVTVR